MVTALFLCPLLSWIFGSFHPAVYIQRNPHIFAEHLTNWAAGIDRKRGGRGVSLYRYSLLFPARPRVGQRVLPYPVSLALDTYRKETRILAVQIRKEANRNGNEQIKPLGICSAHGMEQRQEGTGRLSYLWPADRLYPAAILCIQRMGT